MNLNDNERRVLAFLVDSAGVDGCAYGFAPIVAEIGIDRKVVRRACRSLARKGLAVYHRSLWTDDGVPAGAGYGANKAGEAVRDEFPAEYVRCDGCDTYPWQAICKCPEFPFPPAASPPSRTEGK